MKWLFQYILLFSACFLAAKLSAVPAENLNREAETVSAQTKSQETRKTNRRTKKPSVAQKKTGEDFKKPVSLSQKEPLPDKSHLPPPDPAGAWILQKVLSVYRLKSYRIELLQEVFLSPLKIRIKSKGFLDMEGEKFYLKLEGSPSSLTVFDGDFLWHQPDLLEKTAFQLRNHPQMKLLSGFFQAESFFRRFQIRNFKKAEQSYVFHLQPEKDLVEGLSSVFVQTKGHISEIRLIWKDLNNWQKFHLQPPKVMDFPPKHFRFSTDSIHLIKGEEE